MSQSKPLTPAGRIAFGLLFVAFGAMPMLATFDLGLLDRSDINGPPWLGLAAGGVFAAAGFAVMAGDRLPLLRDLMTWLLLVGLAALGNWVAFGVGTRVCSGDLSLAGLGLDAALGDLTCRIPFAVGALAMIGIVVLAGVAMLQTRLGGPPALARTKAAAEIVLLVCFAPILIVLLLALVVPLAGKVVWTRWTTGAWPRNESFIRRQRERLRRRRDGQALGDAADPATRNPR
jgi:hypothetical protein